MAETEIEYKGSDIGATISALEALGMLDCKHGRHRRDYDGDDCTINRYELDMARVLAAKDAEIALLKSEQDTDRKLSDVYARLKGDIIALQKEQGNINTAQAVYNGTNGATVAAINDALHQITRVVVPNHDINPGWGHVTVVPSPYATNAATPTT